MGILINGKKIAQDILEALRIRVDILSKDGRTPSLTVILVGDNKASATYVRKKGEAAKKVGIDFTLKSYTADISTDELINEINLVQKHDQPDGMIVQLPLPDHIDTHAVLNVLDPKRDVDCLTYENIGKLVMRQALFLPPTPAAILEIIRSQDKVLAGANATIVGAGPLVGKPLAIMLMNERASVTTCNSRTKDFNEKCAAADILVSGVGKAGLITGGMIKDGAIVVDAGVDFVNGSMVGDVAVNEAVHHASAVTPTPGGVGPVTVACLLRNVVLAAEHAIELI
ncbi:bifunctional 5,10-methylenetetrahydrofolate dehydrogenase/5,10-methenyltetrahydrofolate cyclohydrolase [Candidatus Uhrbacteria bacterium]|nr:bifunctional 5,10-methylenetetrahydrofolate dehydrogenase/5,10-methenyltetrahydrofolate cyclohydrolase [Candidatus Uhrbacteria bacterium]